MIRSSLLTALLLGTALSRPVRGAFSDASPPAPDAVSLARLDALNQHAGTIYAAARVANWKEANRLLRQLAASVMALENPADPAQRPLLHAMGKLVRAVRSEDGTATMYAANRVLRWSAEREAGDRPAQAGLARLEFLARELEVASRGGGPTRPEALAEKLRRRWETHRSDFAARIGAPEIRAYGDLIERLGAAPTPAPFGETAVALEEAGQRLRAGLQSTPP